MHETNSTQLHTHTGKVVKSPEEKMWVLRADLKDTREDIHLLCDVEWHVV